MFPLLGGKGGLRGGGFRFGVDEDGGEGEAVWVCGSVGVLRETQGDLRDGG